MTISHKYLLMPTELRKSEIHGYGVFAAKDFAPGEIIEECLALRTNNPDPAFSNYYFKHQEGSSLLLLGLGSIYNHSSNPSASYIFDSEKNTMIFTADRFIKKNEEIFISYGKNWFSSRQYLVKEISWIRKSIKFLSGVPLRASLVLSLIYTILFAIAKLHLAP